MKRIHKNIYSEIILEDYKYPKDTKKITAILKLEQESYCAYTEQYISEAFSVDIDHFNPNFKNSEADNYFNWYLVSHKYNNKKPKKRAAFPNPVLNPFEEDFEQRVKYIKGDCIYEAEDEDTAANNLIDYLNINSEGLTKDRIDYKNMIKKYIEIDGLEETITRLNNYKSHSVKYRRMLEEEFEIII